MCTVDYRPTTCVGTSTIRLHSIKSSLPFSLPLHHSHDRLSQALSRFSVLEAMESWAGPGNKARKMVLHQQSNTAQFVVGMCTHSYSQFVNMFAGTNFCGYKFSRLMYRNKQIVPWTCFKLSFETLRKREIVFC